MSESEPTPPAGEEGDPRAQLFRDYGQQLAALDDLDEAGPLRRDFLRRQAALGLGPPEPASAPVRARPLPRPEPPPASGKKKGRGSKTWLWVVAVYVIVRVLMRVFKDD